MTNQSQLSILMNNEKIKFIVHGQSKNKGACNYIDIEKYEMLTVLRMTVQVYGHTQLYSRQCVNYIHNLTSFKVSPIRS